MFIDVKKYDPLYPFGAVIFDGTSQAWPSLAIFKGTACVHEEGLLAYPFPQS